MYLTSLEIGGFKSFAKKSDLEFTTAITAIVGPNGSGKCVAGATLVQLKTGERIAIRELFDRAYASAHRVRQYDDGVAVLDSDVRCEVPALNLEAQKAEWHPVAAFVRRTAPDTVLTITTRTGRKVTATPYHPLFVLRDGNVEALRADELVAGARVAVPRQLRADTQLQPLSLAQTLGAFRQSDHVYLPSSAALVRTLRKRIGVHTYGSTARYARAHLLAPEVVQRVCDGQALNVAYAPLVFADVPEATYVVDRVLKSKGSGTIRLPEYVDEKVARALGYLVAEGRNAKVGHLWFVNDDPDSIADYIDCIEQSFGVKARTFSYKGETKDVIVFSKTLCRLFERVFAFPQESASREKVVPPQIFVSPNHVVVAFLSALFDGDGHFKYQEKPKRQMYMEYATASEELARDVSSLLLRLGVISVVRRREKYASNTKARTKRPYFSVFVYGDTQLAHLASVLDIRGRKRHTLARFRAHVPNNGNSNIDLVPGACDMVRDLVRDAGVKVKPLRAAYPTLAAYCERRCEATRAGIVRVLEAVALHGVVTPPVKEKMEALRRMAESDVLWDEVVSVQKEVGDGYVYDLSVAGHHNFVANDIFVHNSNVAEAFRFVLGEQSVKSMRGKKGEDLIWGGSHAVARMNRASVKITLNNEARVFPLDFDEIVVERAVHRDGANEYAINGSRVRLRDVQELLAAANIGPTGHHIISQGEADRILSASAKERREMIEDALGLKVYQYKKAESEKKLAKTVENIAQIESLRREVAPHLRFLAGQMKKIEKSIQLREELARVYRAYLKRESLYLAHHEECLATARTAPEAELAALERELASAKATLAAAEQDDKRDALVALEEKIRALGVRRQEALRESGRVEGQLGYIARALADVARAREREVRAPISFAEVERAVDSVERLAADAGTIADLTGMRRLVESMVRTLRSFLNETSRAGAEVPEQARMETERATLERERARHEGVLAAIAEEERVLRGEYDALRVSIEAEASESREAEREVFRIMGRQRELSELLSALTREVATLARDREEFTREIQEAVALIGREVAGYGECTTDADGRTIMAEEVYAEVRTVQLERRRQLEKMKIRLEELGGAGGDEVMKEYKEVGERDAFLAREIADLEQSVGKLEALIADLTAELNEQFVAGIEKIGTEFNRFFILMFGGGQAALVRTKPKPKKKRDDFESLLDESDTVPEEAEEVEEGIDLDVALPNKRVRGLEMLSGGERALTSIALIFAMSQVNPPLFVILDETDAALDEANSRRYGDMIEALAKRSQLILITHNRETMSRAGVLYGVTMGSDGVSKLLSVKFDEAVAVAK